MMYDAIIVGARCAGASTALLLARRGYRVLLLDKASFPSDTISGHFILYPGVRKLAEWGLLETVLASGCPPLNHALSEWGDGPLAGTLRTGDGLPAFICPRRTVLDALLVKAAAEAGVEVREGLTIDGLLADGERVAGVRARTAGGASLSERARIVIGADGKRSTVARLVGAPAYLEQPSLTCWYMTYYADLPSEGLEIHWRENRLILAVPTHAGQTLIAVAWPHREFQAFRADIAGGVEATIAMMPALAARMAGARRAERFTGMADVPNFFRRPHGPGWALVGDAGHHKDPTLARGISDAFCDAALLAEAVDAGLSGRENLGVALAHYEQRRNTLAIPDNEVNLAAATLRHWDTPEVMGLRAALRHSPADIGPFYAARLKVTPPEDFFNPANLGRIIGHAQRRAAAERAVVS